MDLTNQTARTPKKFFFVMSSASLLVFVLQMMLSHGEVGNQAFFFRHNDTYMDFFNTVKVVMGRDPYSEYQFMYPPLAAILMKFFTLLIPDGVLQNSAKGIRMDQSGQMAFLAFLLIAVFCLALTVQRLYRGKQNEKVLLIFLMLFSLPLLYTYERGNTILYAMLFLMMFVYFKDSPNRWMRELALVCLAAAANLKVYPVLFVLLLVREKRWLDTGKAILYSAALFLLPFLCFGGFDRIAELLKTVQMGSAFADNARFGYKVDLTNLLRIVGWVFRLDDNFVLAAGPVFCYGLLALAVPPVLFIRKDWKAWMLLACALIVTPPFNYVYALVYALVPLVAFLNQEKYDRWDWFYAAAFVVILSPVYLGNVMRPSGENIGGYPLTIMNLIQNMLCVVCYGLLIVRGYLDIWQNRKGKKLQPTVQPG